MRRAAAVASGISPGVKPSKCSLGVHPRANEERLVLIGLFFNQTKDRRGRGDAIVHSTTATSAKSRSETALRKHARTRNATIADKVRIITMHSSSTSGLIDAMWAIIADASR